MRINVTLGDMFTQEQLRALAKGMMAEQKCGSGSRSPRRRRSSGDCAYSEKNTREKVAFMRKRKHDGTWVRRRVCDDLNRAMRSFEEDGGKLLSDMTAEDIFRECQGERMHSVKLKPGNRVLSWGERRGLRTRRSVHAGSKVVVASVLVAGVG